MISGIGDFSDVREFNERIDSIEQLKEEGWQEKVIQLIQASYRDDPFLELERLRSRHVLTLSEEVRLKEAVDLLIDAALLDDDDDDDFDFPQTIISYSEQKQILEQKIMAMMARAFEIMKIYKDTHYVFIHAQSSHWAPYSTFLKEIMIERHPEKTFDSFQFLRLPEYRGHVSDITAYSQAAYVDDGESDTRDDLISADAYLYNNQIYESAMFFLSKNTNITDDLESRLSEVIQMFYPQMAIEEVQQFVTDISDTEENFPALGNLFAICIPKEKAHTMQYRAHPFGNPCTCYPGIEDEVILEKLQVSDVGNEMRCNLRNMVATVYDDIVCGLRKLWSRPSDLLLSLRLIATEMSKVLNDRILVPDWRIGVVPLTYWIISLGVRAMIMHSKSDSFHAQFRLFTPALTQENGVKIHLIASDQTYQRHLAQRVQGVIQGMNSLDLTPALAVG